jgi:DNA repair exonuclease SbcCD nuclease subunit
MIKVVATADNHLNSYYAKMTPQQLEERRKRLRTAFQESVEYTLSIGAHLFLHAGDLFDMPDPRTSELIAVAREFRRLDEAGVKVFCIGGTHDVPKMRTAGATPQRIYHESGHAHVFTNPANPSPVTLEIEGMRVAVGGLPTDPRYVRGQDPLEGVQYDAAADLSILLLHYGIEGYIHPDANEPILPKASLAGLSGVDLILVGHQHRPERFGIADKTVFITGSTERMAFGEIGVKSGFWLLEIDGPRDIRSTRVPTHAQPMKDITIHTTELPDDDPTGYIFTRIAEVSQPDQLLKCRLSGPITREKYHLLRQREIWLEGTNHNFYFDWDARELSIARTGAVITGELVGISPREEISAVSQALQAQCADPEERHLIQEACRRALDLYSGR